MSPLEPPVHIQQVALGYCLPACAQMALAQLSIVVTQAQLAQTLGTRVGMGTPFSRVERLVQWNVRVRMVQRGFYRGFGYVYLHCAPSFSWPGAKWMGEQHF